MTAPERFAAGGPVYGGAPYVATSGSCVMPIGCCRSDLQITVSPSGISDWMLGLLRQEIGKNQPSDEPTEPTA
jgi:hypothetical protein